jgi:hypothetical protein
LCRFNTKALLRICPKCLGSAHGSAFCNGLMRCRKCLSSGLNSGNCPVQPRFSRPPLCVQVNLHLRGFRLLLSPCLVDRSCFVRLLIISMRPPALSPLPRRHSLVPNLASCCAGVH